MGMSETAIKDQIEATCSTSPFHLLFSIFKENRQNVQFWCRSEYAR